MYRGALISTSERQSLSRCKGGKSHKNQLENAQNKEFCAKNIHFPGHLFVSVENNAYLCSRKIAKPTINSSQNNNNHV